MKRLRFSIDIRAPRATVWRKMLEQGSKIRFLSPGGEGMVAEIAESRPFEFVSIRHLGFIKDGVDDTESPAARAWAPAYENYTFVEKNGTTGVVVDLDTNAEFEKMISGLWPKALRRLKGICERR